MAGGKPDRPAGGTDVDTVAVLRTELELGDDKVTRLYDERVAATHREAVRSARAAKM